MLDKIEYFSYVVHLRIRTALEVFLYNSDSGMIVAMLRVKAGP
jgi:hypothetical protein